MRGRCPPSIRVTGTTFSTTAVNRYIAQKKDPCHKRCVFVNLIMALAGSHLPNVLPECGEPSPRHQIPFGLRPRVRLNLSKLAVRTDLFAGGPSSLSAALVILADWQAGEGHRFRG